MGINSSISKQHAQQGGALGDHGACNMPGFYTAGAPWYKYASEIVEIEVQEGVTSIGKDAFYALRYVTTVTLADSITTIDDYAFYMCKSLKNIDLPEGVTLGEGVFIKTKVTIA